ncbi:lactate utilisation protein LutB domain-containing protein [Micromonospora sp. NBC_01655]|uniref:lactate utilisation protein LutB domain-containing protein n=1 Tax=Micromonospora sp. NBC_01655 TaxID=2975983 RepID=UPI0033903763
MPGAHRHPVDPGDLRGEHVAARARRPPPSAEAVAMGVAAWVMASPRRFRLAGSALRLARSLGGRRGWITRLPPPLSAWTASRDVPWPPRRTFRRWWRSTGWADSRGGHGTAGRV